jgi:hypothetical protein
MLGKCVRAAAATSALRCDRWHARFRAVLRRSKVTLAVRKIFLLLPVLVACAHGDADKASRPACPTDPAPPKACTVGMGSQNISIVREHASALVGQDIDVRGVLSPPEGDPPNAPLLMKARDDGATIGLRATCPLRASGQYVIARGVLRVRGGDYILDDATVCAL